MKLDHPCKSWASPFLRCCGEVMRALDLDLNTPDSNLSLTTYWMCLINSLLVASSLVGLWTWLRFHWKIIASLSHCKRNILFASSHRALQSQINSIHQLQQHSQTEQSITPLGDLTKEAYLRRQRERLEAREEVLEEHNYQLQVQVHRLRTLLQQVQGELELQRSQHWV